MMMRLTLAALLLTVALPVAATAEEQLVLPIPYQAIEENTVSAGQARWVWRGGYRMEVEPHAMRCSDATMKVAMPPMVGNVAHVEPALPIAGARASWLVFSSDYASLCAIRSGSTDMICQRLAMPNIGHTTASVEQRGVPGEYALRFRVRESDAGNRGLLVMVAAGLAQSIADASNFIGPYLLEDNAKLATTPPETCYGGVTHGKAWQRGECDSVEPVLGVVQ